MMSPQERIQILQSAPPNSWLALDANETKIVGQGDSYQIAVETARLGRTRSGSYQDARRMDANGALGVSPSPGTVRVPYKVFRLYSQHQHSQGKHSRGYLCLL